MVNPKPKNKRVKESEPEAKGKGEWKTKILKEVTTSAGVKWRAQLSVAPDGTKFAGIRKIAVKKDGTEIVTRDGLTFKYDAATIADEVDTITELLASLKGGTVKVGKAPGSEKNFALATPKGHLLTSRTEDGVGQVRAGKKPKLFVTSSEAKAYRETLTNGDAFKVKAHCAAKFA